MGINSNTHRLLYQHLAKQPADTDIVLIGDLFVRNEVSTKYIRANRFYLSEGFRSAVSMDINRSADIKIDLSMPVDDQYIGIYSVLINGGTGEHVENQEIFYQNCHNMTKANSLMIHVGPEEGSFKGHSEIYYTEDFYRVLASKYHYSILSIEKHMHRQGLAIYAVFEKGDCSWDSLERKE